MLALLIVGCSSDTAKDTQGISSIDGVQPDVAASGNDSLPQPDSGVITETGKVSPAELFTHDTEDDCWITYQGAVYDITDFLPKHPGTAAAIVPYCGTGTEFEDAFTTKHGTKNVPVLEKMGMYKGQLG